jgi:hypothetical protein
MASKPCSLLKRGWYSDESGGNESQEEVLAKIGKNGIIKTSNVIISEAKLDSDEDWTDSERTQRRKSSAL